MTLKSDVKFKKKTALWSELALSFYPKSDLSFCPEYKTYEFKIYRGVMCHDHEEWCKIWKGMGFPFQH